MLVRIVAILVCAFSIQISTFAASNPEELGPYPVGVTTTVLVDNARQDDATKGPRTTMTEIWYPSTELGEEFPRNKFTDYLLKGTHVGIATAVKMAFGVDIADLDKNYENIAFRDAPVAEGKFPLVVFSHGNGGFRMQSVFWCEHLASHGYIVVSPDHTGNSAATVVNGKLVLHNAQAREQSAIDRPLDVSYIIDTMTKWNAGADSRFTGKIDLDKIGAGGHSFGGYTSTLVADSDDRVDAIVPMAAVSPDRKTTDTPVLTVIATEDDTIGAEGNARIREYYEGSTGPRYSIEFLDGGHYSFSDMAQFQPDFGDGIGTGKRITNGEPVTYLPINVIHRITNGYTTAFLDKYVKGDDDPALDAYLTGNQGDSGVLIHRSGH
jgi:dienelactone hydrolase